MALIIGPGGKLLIGDTGKLATDTDCCCDEAGCPTCDDNICIEVIFSGWTGGGFACTVINNECIVQRNTDLGDCYWDELAGIQPCSLSQVAVTCLDWGGGTIGTCNIPAGLYWHVYGSPNGGTDSFFGVIPVLAGETYPGSLGGGPRTATFVCDDAGCGDGTVTAEGVSCIGPCPEDCAGCDFPPISTIVISGVTEGGGCTGINGVKSFVTSIGTCAWGYTGGPFELVCVDGWWTVRKSFMEWRAPTIGGACPPAGVYAFHAGCEVGCTCVGSIATLSV